MICVVAYEKVVAFNLQDGCRVQLNVAVSLIYTDASPWVLSSWGGDLITRKGVGLSMEIELNMGKPARLL